MSSSGPQTERRESPIVAVDGPAGSGKSTVCRLLATRLGFVLVDTGALYRSIALLAKENGVDWEDPPALAELANGTDLNFKYDESGSKVHNGSRDLSGLIRTPEISQGASRVSKHPEVRDALLNLQRRLAAKGGVVMEGRDIGTVVCPDAEVKVFLTASPEVRAKRRFEELEKRGVEANYQEILSSIGERDRRDSQRPVAPLVAAQDAVEVDTSHLDIDGVVDVLERLVNKVKTKPEAG